MRNLTNSTCGASTSKTNSVRASRKSVEPISGYKSKRPKPVPKPVPKIQPMAPTRPSVPLPGKAQGVENELLAQVLKTKVKLLRHLMATVGEVVSVSIEVYKDQWVLLVHGPNPGLRYFDNYPVFWARSKVLGR